jgi:hypothetical protein
VFGVAPDDPGVSVVPQEVTGGDGTALVELRRAVVPDDRILGGSIRASAAIMDWLIARATVGLCALQLGVTERALELTAAYARTREQFGKPIGSFQAVSQRRGHPPDALAGGLAAGGGPACRYRGRDGEILGGRGRPPGRARRRAYPRRRRD